MNQVFGFATAFALICCFLFSSAATNAESLYRYDRTIALPAIGPSYAAGEMPLSGSGAKGLHFAGGLLYVAQNSAEIVQIVDITDDTILRTIYNTEIAGTTMSNLTDVWADENGNVWAVGDGATVPSMLYADSDDTSFTEGFTLTDGRAYALDRDSEGNFFLGRPDGPLTRRDSAGNLLNSYAAYDHNCYAGMDADAAGEKVYLAGRYNNAPTFDKKLYSVNIPAGDYALLSDSHGISAEPTGLQLDETNGNVFLAIRSSTAGNNCVIKYDLAGNIVDQWNEWDPVTGEVSHNLTNSGRGDNGIDRVFGIAVDETTGTVYVARDKLYDSLGAGQAMAEVIVFTVVPEPGVLVLMAAVLAGLSVYLGRRREQ